MSTPMTKLSAVELEQLQALHDIVLPAAPGPWPLAPGWWLLVLLLALLTLRAALHLWQVWRRNAYRRLALRRLRALRANSTLAAQAQLTEALRILHAALRALEPGENDWRTILRSRLPATSAAPSTAAYPEALLAQAPYWPPVRVGPEDAQRVLDYAEHWLREHRGRP